VITEDTGARHHLPANTGFSFVRNADEAEAAVNEVLRDWRLLSAKARACAVEVFDSRRNLKTILDL